MAHTEYGVNPLFNPASKAQPNRDSRSRAQKLLANAPSTLAVLAIVTADLAFNGVLVTKTRPETAGSPVTGLSCERGSCQRQTADVPPLAMRASVPTGKPRLLEFTSKHCASCGRMEPLVRKMERDCTAHDGTILPVDVDTDSGDLLANRYAINTLPTYLMVDSNGDEVRRLVGEQPWERLTVALADVNGVLCQML